MAKLLIFDFDGTLCNTAPGIHLALNNTLKRLGLPTVSLEEVTLCISHGLQQLVRKLNLAETLGPKKLQKLIRIFYQEYESIYLEHSQPFPGVIEFLQKWPHEIAIASNKNVLFVKRALKQGPLNQFSWLEVFGGNSFENKKPHPQMILEIIKSSQFSPKETLMIGDGEPDVQVAQNAGIKSLSVSFGYAPIERLIELGTDSHINHFNELELSIQKLWPT